jgi:hypothetical protein
MTQWDIDSFSNPGSPAWIALDELNKELKKHIQEDSLKLEKLLDGLTCKWYPGYVAYESEKPSKKELPVHLL